MTSSLRLGGENASHVVLPVIPYEDTGEATLVATNSSGFLYPWAQARRLQKITHSTNKYDPAKTSVRTEYARTILVGDRELLFEAVLDFHSDLENFHYVYTRKVFENGELLHEKTWDETISRVFH